LAPSMPVTAVSTLVSFLSLAGVPPTLGFWAGLEVLAGIVRLFLNSGVAGLAVAATLSVLTVFSAAYGLLCFKRVFFGPPKVRVEEKLSEPVAVALTLSLVSVAFGRVPGAASRCSSSITVTYAQLARKAPQSCSGSFGVR
jgi:NADH:ubiquinone oxidoreductase subunit 5 (subunit L)/multisubunit Na+/H+ antiporter MnhA subunit